MNSALSFFKRYVNCAGFTGLTQANTLALAEKLIDSDHLGKTKFEVSFKVVNGRIPCQARFLNIDADAYSCKSPEFFMERLGLYRSIMEGKANNPRLHDVINALALVSKTPMDLYFGADIENRKYLFAFWLIFGGVKKSGATCFWNYDFEAIIASILKQLKFKRPLILKNAILNFGLDICERDIYYKIYYLYKENGSRNNPFMSIMDRINDRLFDYRVFYYFSHMYDKSGTCVKTKLFAEFLEDIVLKADNLIGFLKKIGEISHLGTLDTGRLSAVIKSIGGRISLISFEEDNTLTFYIRSDLSKPGAGE